jgi:hypothetical protein
VTTTKPAVLSKNDDSNDLAQRRQPAVVDDGYMSRRENDLSSVEEALQIHERDFCVGILELLYDVTGIFYHGDTYFNYALSILKDYKFINKRHVTLVLDDIRCQLAEKRTSEKASEPIQHDVFPSDFAWAQFYGRDVSTLPKRRMIIDDQTVVEFRLRWLARLIQTRIELLDAINRYEAAAELLNKSDSVTLVRRRRAIKRDSRRVANGKTQPVESNGHAPT